MATQHLEISAVSATASDSITAVTAGDPTLAASSVAVVYDDTLSKADVVAALEKAKNRLTELLG